MIEIEPLPDGKCRVRKTLKNGWDDWITPVEHVPELVGRLLSRDVPPKALTQSQ